MLDRPCLRLPLVLVPCALLFLTGMPAGAADEPSDLAEKGGTGRISGTVTAAATGEPLSLIGVSLFRSNGAEAGSDLTESDGRYRFAGLAPGIYFVRTNDVVIESYADQLYDHIPCPPGCDPTTGTPISVNADETTNRIDFELRRFGTFSGMITDSMTGEPVGGIEIVAWDEQGNDVASTHTGVEGTYLFFPLPSGSYFLSTNSYNFDFRSYRYSDELYDEIPCPGGAPGGCDPTAGTPVQLDVETSPTVDFALVRNGWISGRITEEASGLPLAGIEVAAFDQNGAFVTDAGTDAEGMYVLRAFFPGNYLVRALGVFGSRPSSYVYELYDDVPCPLPPESCDLSLGTPIPAAAATTTPGIDFTLLSTGNITGTVIDASTGQAPRSSVDLRVFNETGEPVYFEELFGTDYAVTGLAPGTYFVTIDSFSEYFNELYQGIRCSDGGCDPTTGTPITLGFAETAAGIDFALTPRFDGCIDTEHTLCLNDGRFRVNLNWSDFEQEGGAGFAEQLTDDSGYFYFRDSENVEVVVKVLRACFGATPRYWVYAGGLTNLQTELIVTDTVTGQRHRYDNPLGTAFELIRDTETFTSCDAGLTSGETSDAVAASQADASFDALVAGLANPGAAPPLAASSEKGLCFFGPTSLCLTDNRFEVTATWTAGSMPPTPAAAEPLTADTGYFTFLDPNNVEVVIKVLDACGLDPFHNFWVFAAGLTDVEVVLRVRDTDSGEEQVYTNALGDSFVPVQDTTHFATCP